MPFLTKIKSWFQKRDVASWRTAVAAVRREYAGTPLTETSAGDDPLALFEIWFGEAIKMSQFDPNAFTFSTCANNKPASRVVLLKGYDERGFVFYTHYDSDKGRQIAENPNVSLCFHWPELFRQLRIEGRAEKISPEESDAYFDSRPEESRISAAVSPQSHEIPDRAMLEEKKKTLKKSKEPVKRPADWGGYRVVPERYEFWQGRTGRLHDRIVFFQDDAGMWVKKRLAP